jgi:hypothetical protein
MLKFRIVAAFILLISASCSTPAQAQNPARVKPNNSLVQVQPTREQILNACVLNRAETLPNPFTIKSLGLQSSFDDVLLRRLPRSNCACFNSRIGGIGTNKLTIPHFIRVNPRSSAVKKTKTADVRQINTDKRR